MAIDDEQLNMFEQKKKNNFKIQSLEKVISKNKHIIDELQSIDYDELSPKKAFDILWKIKQNSA